MTSDGKELVAYCGLYCGDCFGYQGKVADLARDLRKELRAARFDKTAEVLSEYSFFDVFKGYARCYEVLGALVKFRCKRGCRSGGGSPFCRMRRCCERKGIDGCWECDAFETCEKLEFLSANHGDAHLRNLRKIRRGGIDGFLSGKRWWYAKPPDA
jgi:hypothetical protein